MSPGRKNDLLAISVKMPLSSFVGQREKQKDVENIYFGMSVCMSTIGISK